MLRWRWTALLVLGSTVGYSSMSLRANFDPLWICCIDQSECGNKLICCPAEMVSNYVCDIERVGYCLPACIWIGGE